jgi:DNA topoisomerase II
VTHVYAAITKEIMAILNKKYPDLGITPQQIKSELVLFVNLGMENPSFDSQSKEYLTTKTSKYYQTRSGKEVLFQPTKSKIVQFLAASNLEETIVRKATAKKLLNSYKLPTKAGKATNPSSIIRVNFPKLEDAYYAGKRSGQPCTLILTEGDSAKALAVAGLELIGRDYFGVYPLRGKFLNVREASATQIRNNQEIINLCKIIGLDFSKSYVDGPDEDMRYDRVMIMADQDNDGSHIKVCAGGGGAYNIHNTYEFNTIFRLLLFYFILKHLFNRIMSL